MTTVTPVVIEAELEPVNPLVRLERSLQAALDDEEERYTRAQQNLEAEHANTVSRLLAALNALSSPVNPSSVNGNGKVPVGTLIVDLRDPPVPVVADDDEVVDTSRWTVKQFIRAVMSTRPGEVWRAEDILEQMKRLGYSGGANDESRLGTVRASLGQMVAAGELRKPKAAQFIQPKRS